MKLLLARFRSSPGKALLEASLACLIVIVICAAEKTDPVENDQQLKSVYEKFEKAQSTIDQLEEENASLRRENQELRRMVAEAIESSNYKTPINPPDPPPSLRGSRATYQSEDLRTNPPPRDEAALTHWLSLGGKRHNSSCRHFKKPAGQPCGPNDGIACTLCGG